MVVSLYEASAEQQDLLVQKLVHVARMRIAQQKAETLSRTLGDTLDDMILREVFLFYFFFIYHFFVFLNRITLLFKLGYD